MHERAWKRNFDAVNIVVPTIVAPFFFFFFLANSIVRKWVPLLLRETFLYISGSNVANKCREKYIKSGKTMESDAFDASTRVENWFSDK